MSNTSCLSFPDDPNKCDVLIAVRRAFASISLIGSVFMIFVIWLFKRYVAFNQRLILHLSISVCLNSIGYLMATQEDGHACNFEGWFGTFFAWQVLLWASCITFNLYMNVIRMTVTARFEWLYLAVCWAVPFVISLLPLFGDHYGRSGAWCWIVEDTAWRMGIWYGPLIIFLIGLSVVYTYIIIHLKRRAANWDGMYDPDTVREHQLLEEDIGALRAYPFIYVATMIFPLINRIQNAINPDEHVFVLVLLAGMSAPLDGLFNALVFGLNKETLQKLRPSQIKLAFRAQMAPKSVVQEYPQPDTDTNALNQSDRP